MESLSAENLESLRKILQQQDYLRTTADAFFDLMKTEEQLFPPHWFD